MRRIDRKRRERLQRGVLVIGLSFALGALVDTALTWRLHEFEGANEIARATDAAPAEAASVATTGSRAVVPRREAPARNLPSDLRGRNLEMPVAGVRPSALQDTFSDSRALGRAHEAIDIMAPKGTRVFAVEDGTIAKLFRSVAGGITIYQFDPSGEYTYYYAHLDSYASGLREGQIVKRGQTIGYVGSTGNASESAPHLHFAIFKLGPDHKWWQGEAINPYPLLK
jgi:murein DD-endopeptidase MepM/ murein hydrolase activator NlpD